ncbi:MAG: alpha-E domain-containing protein [Leadbetterella sp.]|jgi:uncharacterized alpha-E superfamily protein|nr:alpha-E domain-containing protein [Leadbetterella sp.]
MLSRVANSIYWMNRYIERVENYARFVSVNINLSYDLPGMISEHWGLLLEATHDKATYDKLYSEETEDKIIYFITFDPNNPNSIFNILGNARENARTVKETLPKEIWEHLNSFYLSFKQFSTTRKLDFEELPNFYENIKQQCQLFAGMIDGTLLRDEAYYFANMGKFLERADKTSRFLDIGYFNFKSVSDVKTANPQDLLVWSAVLKSVSAFNMYRQQYKSLKQENIIEFLIKDRDFPRAICHSIKKAEYAIYRISGARPQDSYSNEAEKAITQLKHDIDFTETNEIIKYGLHKYLNDFQVKNNKIDLEIFKVYFA